MSAVESMAVLFPRFTTLAGNYVFASPALDVSRFGGMQARVWWSERLGNLGSTPTKVHFDESLDGVDWPSDATTSFSLPSGETYTSRFFSIGFRMRWFRMRFDTQCEYITIWAEGALRAGAMGAKEWVVPRADQAHDETAMIRRKSRPLDLVGDRTQRPTIERVRGVPDLRNLAFEP